MIIDKFYRVYNPYSTTEARSSKKTFNLKDERWDGLDYKIGSVAQGEYLDDVSTLGQTLTRKGDSFVQGNDKYEFMELKDDWNAKKRKIVNGVKAEQATDIPILDQIVRYDLDKNVFKYKDLVFDLMKYNSDILIADPSTKSGLATLDGNPYSPENYKRLEEEKTLYIKKDLYDRLEQRVVKLEKAMKTCLQLNEDETFWDAKNKKITNVKAGNMFGDVSTFDQTLTYDNTVMKFKIGDKYFDITENSVNKPVLTAKTNEDQDIIYVGYGTNTEIPSTRTLRWSQKLKLLYDKNEEVVWDENTKSFMYRVDTKWAKDYPQKNIKQYYHDWPLPN